MIIGQGLEAKLLLEGVDMLKLLGAGALLGGAKAPPEASDSTTRKYWAYNAL